MPDAALLKKLNLTQDEYRSIVKILGRAPTTTELGIFSVQWSEHCAYKSSKIYLKTFPTRGKGVLIRAGEENAGVIDIGDGLGVAFKIESHNHPSAVEPHAGAATGVGGILRDIFTMGARPIALFDSLRFGPLNGSGRTRFLFGGVVKGIADYGNAVGVPTIGGEIAFDETYRENPLVNVMCIGIVPRGSIAVAKARGAGNPVVYVGSSTGRDGLGGASFASREITDGSEADRPAVQIGDPFAEKCVLEATLEVLATGDVIAIQDMGAAGLTCSTCETASRGRCGIEIDVAKVPRREEGMTPFEVMLSESQERMLLIVKRGREAQVARRFAKWGLHAVQIGRVKDGNLMRVKDGDQVVAEIPVGALTHEAPVYRRPTRRPAYLSKAQRLSLRAVSQPRDYGEALLALLGAPTIASKALVFEQYDHMVQTNTVVLPGRADAAVLRVKGTGALLAATTDANATYCYLDPYEGGKLAVAEAARNLVCVGAKPLAVTDCLNFGNPEDPEVMWQFKECVRGIAEACRAFGTPVTGGNVSFYNESPRGAIDPTPVIGMVGLIECGMRNAECGMQPITASFKQEGDAILLFGETREELGGSEYLKLIHHRKQGRPPACDLPSERRLGHLMLELAHRGLIKSAHDCSEGGLAVALAECCITEPEHLIGAALDLSPVTCHLSLRPDALLFGESAGRIVVTCERYHQERIEALAKRVRVPLTTLGRVGGTRLVIRPRIDLTVEQLSRVWRAGLAGGAHA
ncbi:MAG: phosphoribosylformylglycinamidine synthase II [Omnitrophica WOR_2 bacterium RIFCSPHIGHO2_02_FULL_63_39]|nr:MAG: phosphoribosylformylglycinamidine synthase II [Omnitrophica WOR_2 bacterium GWA2_63_20]OGX35337.1 MAG: phosphoribosylformylglycinamidine synthase II [Omnitrophica WOR_2 bacterium RIFCSPHIGHO2_02_FULL_63_39]OGX47101.1 MAG: phosphoribosylformylglycinamidine synthase II [Omnitrophica WOR_2 bacterium RIFCSPLOWO2_12_FULL_63_16]